MNGALLEEAKLVLDTQEEGDLMGHPWRFEQLCRGTGRLQIGDEAHAINGGANRIRRQSVRREAKLRGHAWQACLLPSGRAFGYIAYPPRDDGKDTYNEGYLFEGDAADTRSRRPGAVAPDAHAQGRGRLVRARGRGWQDGDDRR